MPLTYAPELAALMEAFGFPQPWSETPGVYVGPVTFGAPTATPRGFAPAIAPGLNLGAAEVRKSPRFIQQFQAGLTNAVAANIDCVGFIWGAEVEYLPWTAASAPIATVGQAVDAYQTSQLLELVHTRSGVQGALHYDLSEASFFPARRATTNQLIAAADDQYAFEGSGPMDLLQQGGIVYNIPADNMAVQLAQATTGGVVPETYLKLHGIWVQSGMVKGVLPSFPTGAGVRQAVENWYASRVGQRWGSR